MKIYRRIATWIMMGFIVLVPILLTVLFAIFSEGKQPNNWEMMTLETQILFQLITIFTVVKAAESVAGEFTMGTIKLLLIRPWSRSSILLSKFISVVLFALFFSLVSFAVTWLINVIVFGYSAHPAGLIPPNSPLSDASPWAYVLMAYLDQFIALVVIVTFGFMLSSAFRSSGLAIGLSIFLLLSGNLVSGLLAMADKPWVKFVLFPHLGLTSYLDGGSPVPNYPTTYGFSLAVLAVYFLIFNLVSWTVFTKRDVAG